MAERETPGTCPIRRPAWRAAQIPTSDLRKATFPSGGLSRMPMERWDLTCKRCGRLFDIAVREYRSTELRREHHGSVATNNLIRVVIADEVLRGYVYQFLQSRHGRRQLLKSTYGTNQDHIEPAHVEEVLIPIPKDRSLLEGIGSKALASVEHLQESREAFTMAARRLERLWDDRMS